MVCDTMAPNQSLHLWIDEIIQLIPISMKLVQIWWCKDQIFLEKKGVQNVLEQCLHLLIGLYIISMDIRRHHPQFLRCEDQKTRVVQKGTWTHFFANSNKTMLTIVRKWTCSSHSAFDCFVQQPVIWSLLNGCRISNGIRLLQGCVVWNIE